MKISKIGTVILIHILTAYLLNADITGLGYSKNVDEAQKEALANLSENIKVEVLSNFQSQSVEKNKKFQSYSKSDIKTSSNLPILGHETEVIKNASIFEVKMKMVEAKVKPLYTKKLNTLNKEISSILKELEVSKSSSLKLQLNLDLYSLLKEYDRYESVAMVINAKLPPSPTITIMKTKSEISKLKSNIDSIDMATGIFADKFTQANIFVYPPTLQNNSFPSEFGAVFEKKLKSKLKTVSSLKGASYILVGQYTLTEKSMVLYYELLDTKTNKKKASRTVTINANAYKDLQVMPKAIDIKSLLESGIVKSGDLSIFLTTARGSENLLFREGEEIEFFVKSNALAYYYIVGYTQTDANKLGYLLELSDGEGNDKFIKFINADDANKIMSIGAFIVEKPFGFETIQIFASNKKEELLKTIPNVQYDRESMLYIISKDVKKTFYRTRAFSRAKKNKSQKAGYIMNLTTMQKK